MAEHFLQNAPRRIDRLFDQTRTNCSSRSSVGGIRTAARGALSHSEYRRAIIEIGINSASEFVASATTSINYGWPGKIEKGSWAYPNETPTRIASRKSGDGSRQTFIINRSPASNGGVISSLNYNACLVGAALCEVVVRESSDEDQIY